MRQELEDIAPQDALDDYLDDREVEGAAEWTLYAHKSRLGHFVEWCEEKGIESMADLRPSHMRKYRKWRKDEGDIKTVTLKTQMDTFRVFVKWCEDFKHAPKNLHKAVKSPKLAKGDNVREETIDGDVCMDILDQLRKYHYATRAHVIFELMWHTTMRRGAIHSLDVDDFDRKKQQLKIRHRPKEGSTLKKKKDSERTINLSDEVTETLADWVDDQRPDVVDEYDRRPLIATEHGRAHLTTISSDVYWVTRPGFRGEDCGCRDECPATCANNAYACEDSVSPHTVRSASITYHLDQGWLIDLVADRADNTADVIKKHYDAANEDEQAERRKKFMGLLKEEDEEDEDDEGEDGAPTATAD